MLWRREKGELAIILNLITCQFVKGMSPKRRVAPHIIFDILILYWSFHKFVNLIQDCGQSKFSQKVLISLELYSPFSFYLYLFFIWGRVKKRKNCTFSDISGLTTRYSFRNLRFIIHLYLHILYNHCRPSQ